MDRLRAQQLVDDSVFILQCLRENERAGRHNALPEVAATLDGAVALDLDAYLAFLRRYGYVAVDAEELRVTDAGEHAARGAADVQDQVELHFAEVLRAPEVEPDTQPEAVGPQQELVVVQAPALEPVDGEVGQGPLSRVRVARYGELGQLVAIREPKAVWECLPWLTRAELARRTRREAQAQAQLDHPFIARLVDLRTSPEGDALVVAPLAASTLREKLRRSQRLALGIALRIGAQVAHALACAHQRSVFHGALKPENVLLDAAGNAQLADFGAARLIELPAGTQPGPRVVVELREPAYLAPEVSAREPSLGPGDAFAFGALLLEMVAGAPGATLPAEVPEPLRALVAELRDLEPSRRPQLSHAAARLTAQLQPHPLIAL